MTEKEKKRAAITMAVDCLQRKGSVIESSQKVCSLVKETDELEVSQKLVRQVLKEFRLSFIKAKSFTLRPTQQGTSSSGSNMRSP